ncbi:MAG TPA: RagB/SusD family nutrient uptake outer membrane protein [Flavisolibacter sp.]|jgi:hypothetical protein|nr:RagB/SusD family nutrient uptake outer membrane protein [Flavisolibacter sp.]
MTNNVYHAARLLGLLLLLQLSAGCKKFLEEKPDKKLAVPAALNDLERLLDNYTLFNSQYPAGGEIASDDYYLTSAAWGALASESHRNLYRWLPDDAATNDWSPAYQRVYNANLVLEELERIGNKGAEPARVENIRGAALFYRGMYYFGLSQLFCKPWEAATAAQDPGLPLRLDTDVGKLSVRSTVQQTYDRIFSDLAEAARLLPTAVSPRSRPSRWAAYAALARVSLSMRLYDRALLYADSCLQGFSTLLDYNSLNGAAAFPFPLLNAEVIWDGAASAPAPLAQSRWRVDTLLYASYSNNDLRKTLFFRRNSDGSFTFKGGYGGGANPFCGLATNEVLLVRAECRARAGETGAAMDDLNTLLEKRWRTGTFVPQTAATPAEALALVLAERRRELLFRTLRWTDIRRLGFEASHAITPKRLLENTVYELPPGSSRYVFKIPRTVIQASGMQQNP